VKRIIKPNHLLSNPSSLTILFKELKERQRRKRRKGRKGGKTKRIANVGQK